MKIKYMEHVAPWMLVFIIVTLFLDAKPLTIKTDDYDMTPFLSTVSMELPKDPKEARSALARARSSLAQLQERGPYIVINTHANVLSLRTADRTIRKASCSTGSGGTLVSQANDRTWVFSTPAGKFHVTSKLVDPWWRRPDWAYIEENQAIPASEKDRYDPEMLGDYAIGFGDGYYIHGTIYEQLLGISVTHGCVRLGEEDLKNVFYSVTNGTPIYIF